MSEDKTIEEKNKELKEKNIEIIEKIYYKNIIDEEQMLNKLYSEDMSCHQAFSWVNTTKEFLIKKTFVIKVINQIKSDINRDGNGDNIIKKLKSKEERVRYYDDIEQYKDIIFEITNKLGTNQKQLEDLIWYQLLYDKLVKGIYKYAGNNSAVVIIDYDNDSSPFAWEYYSEIYSGINFYSNTFNEKDECNNQVFKLCGKKGAKRYIGVFTWKNNIHLQQIEFNGYKSDKTLKFGGDCSFNFKTEGKNAKFETFKEIIENSSKNQDEKNTMISKLNFCAMMHHSPLNFAIMPVTGGLNNAKGKGKDRLDVFFKDINDFYTQNVKTNAEIKDVIGSIRNAVQRPNILKYSSKNNLKSIIEFLLDVSKMPFDGIKGGIPLENSSTKIQKGTRKYVKLFYPWVNDELLKRLITNGGIPIEKINKKDDETKKRKIDALNAYMDLAIEYWTAAADYYDEQRSKKQNKTESDTE